MGVLTVSATTDFSGLFLTGVDAIDFTNPAGNEAIAIFDSRQFETGRISNSLAIDGSAGINGIVVNCPVFDLDASGWTFSNWLASDKITINGSDLADRLTGSVRGDTINGGSGNDTIKGENGGDVLNGDGGSDTIRGGNGNDILNGGSGGDRLYGGTGLDTLSYAGSLGAVDVDLGANRARGGEASGDRIDGFENLTGGEAGDRLQGNGGANLLTGGAGADDLTGGGAADSFVYVRLADSPSGVGHDRIRDFSHAEGDVIDLSAIDALIGSGNDSFGFIGEDDFDGAGQVRFFQASGQTIVQADRNGDGIADLEIALDGTITLTAADFIL